MAHNGRPHCTISRQVAVECLQVLVYSCACLFLQVFVCYPFHWRPNMTRKDYVKGNVWSFMHTLMAKYAFVKGFPSNTQEAVKAVNHYSLCINQHRSDTLSLSATHNTIEIYKDTITHISHIFISLFIWIIKKKIMYVENIYFECIYNWLQHVNIPQPLKINKWKLISLHKLVRNQYLKLTIFHVLPIQSLHR